MFKTSQNHVIHDFNLFLGFFQKIRFFDPLFSPKMAKIVIFGHIWRFLAKNGHFWPKNSLKVGKTPLNDSVTSVSMILTYLRGLMGITLTFRLFLGQNGNFWPKITIYGQKLRFLSFFGPKRVSKNRIFRKNHKNRLDHVLHDFETFWTSESHFYLHF